MADAPLEISVGDVQRLIAQKEAGFRVVDVREPDEFAICRLPGAELIPLGELPASAAGKLADKAAEVVVYCHHGMRSMAAVKRLRDLGYANARSMAGGVDRWSLEIDSTVARY